MPKQSTHPDSTEPQLPAPNGEMLVLSVLAEGPSYGYRITKEIAARSQGAFSLGPGQLYPLLTKLEKHRFVEPEWETVRREDADESSRGRPRKWYRLTQRGEKRLADAIASHRRFTTLIEAFIGTPDRPAAGEGASA